MKSLALVPLFALLVAAQNPLIPASISSGCSSFLKSLNSDKNLATCTKALIGATSSFSPTGAPTNVTTDSIKSTLKTLCAAEQTSCQEANIRKNLADFYTACSDELVGASPNLIVQTTFDVLYMLKPFTDSVCSKTGSGGYCVLNMGASASGTGDLAATATASAGGSAAGSNDASRNLDPLQAAALKLAQSKQLLVTVHTDADFPNGIGGPPEKRDFTIDTSFPNGLGAPAPAPRAENESAEELLRRTQAESELARRAADVTALMANATTFSASNIMYLFILPSLAADKLCTECTKSVMVSYLLWEQSTPYPTSLSKSPILGGEEALWNGIKATCGEDFANSVLGNAGADPNAAAGTSAASSLQVRGGALAAALGAAFFALVAL